MSVMTPIPFLQTKHPLESQSNDSLSMPYNQTPSMKPDDILGPTRFFKQPYEMLGKMMLLYKYSDHEIVLHIMKALFNDNLIVWLCPNYNLGKNKVFRFFFKLFCCIFCNEYGIVTIDSQLISWIVTKKNCT